MSPERAAPISRWWHVLAGVACSCAVVVGFWVLLRYQWSPGPGSSAPERWPTSDSVALDPVRPTLLLFAHPQCPCTRATIGELDRIAARLRDRVRIFVFVLSEPELGEEWTHTDLWTAAASIPGVQVQADPSGAMASRFGARTSGQILLYEPGGHLLFQGGITDARGHAGDNPGESAVVGWVLAGTSELASTPVYGCLLRAPSQELLEAESP